jgi:hypothetical protein
MLNATVAGAMIRVFHSASATNAKPTATIASSRAGHADRRRWR